MTTIDKVSYVLLAIALGIYVTAQGLTHNPDMDSFFLISFGKYIVTHGALPTTAYWMITPDVPTIVQQWLCDVLNYCAYAAGGYTGMVILGILFNLTLLGALFLYCRNTCKSNQVGFNAAAFCWILLGGFASTRPYSITISLALLEGILLRNFFANEKHTKRRSRCSMQG